jgi:hypothetical protein
MMPCVVCRRLTLRIGQRFCSRRCAKIFGHARGDYDYRKTGRNKEAR